MMVFASSVIFWPLLICEA